MKHKSKKTISLILALLLVVLQCGVLSVNAASSSEGKTVYFKLPDEWKGRVDANTGETILPAAYVAGGTDGEHVPWVGEHLTLVDEANDIWSYTIPGDQTLINFNTGQQRDWQTVDLAIPGDNMIFLIDNGAGTKTATGHWEPYNTDEPRVAVSTGVFQFVGEVTINLYCYNCDNAYYTVDGGEEIVFENGQAVTIGGDIAPLSATNITLTAVKGDESYSYEYTFTKNNSRTVYAKNSAGWDDVYVHYWGGESTSIWPGVKMKKYADSEDVYYCEIPSKSTNYKFNNGGSEGTDESQQTVNLATQDIVEGVSEVYVINPLIEGESANLGEYVSLDRALSDEPVEGMPILSVDNAAPALGEEFMLNVNLQNVPQLSGYVANIVFDKNVITPVENSTVISSKLGDVITNVKSNGELSIVCSNADAVDYTEKDLLVSIPFKVVASETQQIKVSVKVADMFADEETEVSFPSSNIVAGKITVGVDKSVLEEKIAYINDLDESKFTAVSYQNALTVAKNAQSVLDSLTSTQDVVDAQVALLTQAIDALVETQGDGNYFYFKNTTQWEDVYAYWWGSEEACPAFPGITATKVDGTVNLYSVQLPEDATGLNFNNGKAGTDGGEQTDSITGEKLALGNVFVPDPNDSYEKNGGLRFRGVSEKYVPNTIYFKNVMNWDDVYTYWWGSTASECLPFPGVKPKKLAGTNDIYYVTFPEDATGFNFSNGKAGTDGGEQTSSISTFEPGKILVIDPDSAYEKNGGIRYNAYYDILEKYTTGLDVLIGDVDKDGTVRVTDATLIQKSALSEVELDDVQTFAADVNGDGAINITDATAIQKYIVKLESDSRIATYEKYFAA